MRSRLPYVALLAAVLVVALAAPSAAGSAACGASDYSYAGFQAGLRAHGIGATLTVLRPADVREGHVAAWVGVGGPGLGPNGTDAWIQVGLSAFPGGGATSLYLEVTQPGAEPRYVEIEADVAAGERRRVAVLELARRQHWWRVWVDGRPVGVPVHLPGSHGAWRPIATAESWNAGSRACNRFHFRFGRVAVARRPGGSWAPFEGVYAFEDPGYRVVEQAPAGFLASARTQA